MGKKAQTIVAFCRLMRTFFCPFAPQNIIKVDNSPFNEYAGALQSSFPAFLISRPMRLSFIRLKT